MVRGVWRPVDQPWQFDLLDRLPPSIDESLLDESLRLTPTERIEKMMKLLEVMEELRRAREAKGGR